MMKFLVRLKLNVLLLLGLLLQQSLIYAQSYTLQAKDVTIVNGLITACSYDFVNGSKDIIITDTIGDQVIFGIGEGVFRDKGLTSVVIPSTLQFIGKEAFRRCPLKNVDFGTIKGELSIGEASFRDCTFDTLIIGKNVKTIGLNAFRNNKMKSLTFATNCVVDSIAESAFRYNLLSNITVPKNLRFIGNLAFNVNNIEELRFEENSSLKIIANSAFEGSLVSGFSQRNKLKNIVLPKSLELIQKSAFKNNLLTSVVFEAGSKLKTLEPGAFIDNFSSLEIALPILDTMIYKHWLASNGTQYVGGDKIKNFVLGYEAIPLIIVDYIVYVSQSTGNDINDGLSIEKSVRTLKKAKELAAAQKDNINFGGYKILLKAGDLFDDLTSMTSSTLVSDDAARSKYAFVWDINKPLLLSTYGGEAKAMIYSGKYTHEGGPQGAVAVSKPSTKQVIIENIHIKRFQTNAFLALETSNVIFRNNKVEEIGTLYFPDEKDNADIYCAGVFYVRNSSNVKALHNEFLNMHNGWFKYGSTTENSIDALHTFYLTRLTGGEIAYNTINYTSGPPLKFRRSSSNNIHIHDNKFYHTGPSIQVSKLKGLVQTGWVRYSGDANEGCPYAITIENNIFHYPYCWEEYEKCATAVAEKYSISNPAVCGADACEDTLKVRWLNNDFKYSQEVVSTIESNILSSHVKYLIDPHSKEVKIVCNVNNIGNTTIQVFDIYGRMTNHIYAGILHEGEHTFSWRGQESGFYFIRTLINRKINIFKIIL